MKTNQNSMRLKFPLILLLTLTTLTATAGNVKFGIATNALEWANFGTVNLEAGLGVSRHFSIQVDGRYNPWTFGGKSDLPTYYHQTSASVGARWWPWYVFSGWWVGAKAKYSDVEKTGIWRPALEKTSSIGAGLSVGYTLMIHEHFNIEFGAGFWGGTHYKYNLYDCPKCMKIRESGSKAFIGVDMVSVSFMYVF